MDKASSSRTVVGFLINQSEGRYQALLRRGLSDLCRERGIALRLFVGRSLASPYGTEDDENHVYALARPGRREERLDGLVISAGSIGSYVPAERTARFLDTFRPLPLVTIGLAAPGHPAVVCDNARGVTEMVMHLVRIHGHRRFAYLGGPSHAPDAAARLVAFHAALQAAGLEADPALVFQGDFTHRSGELVAASLEVSGQLPFDAVVAANDDMALGFVEGLERRGFVCPRDYAITGFDDLPDARIASPALTTVHQPLYREGRAAGERLLDYLARGDWGPAPLVDALPANPVVRRSCGCSEEPRIASRVHRATEPKAQAAGSLREAVVAAAEELSLSVRNRDQAADVLSALAETILLDLRTFRDRPLFLQTLSEWFDLTTGWEDFSADWHSLLTLFHRETLKTIVEPRSREHVDDLMQAGFALLARKAGERDARELAALRVVMSVFRDLSGRLSTVADVDGLLQALRDMGPLAGLTRLEVFLLRGGPVPLGARDDQDAFLGEVDRRVCIAAGSGDEQTVLPLVSRRHAHGYLVVESPRCDGMVFDLVRDQSSQALGSILLARERSRAEDALRRSEERFRELASAVPMMVLETDLALNVTYVNPAGREGLGLAAEPDASLRRHLPPEDEALASDLVRRIGQVRTLSYPGVRLVNHAGRRYVPVVQISGVFDRAGQLTGIRWNALDPLPLLAGGMLPDPAFFAERKITGREQEVVELLLQGFRIRDMADRLSIAESTVKGHLTQVYNKLGISGRDELLRLLQEEQVRSRGFSAYVFGLVSRLLNVGGDEEEPISPPPRSS